MILVLGWWKTPLTSSRNAKKRVFSDHLVRILRYTALKAIGGLNLYQEWGPLWKMYKTVEAK